MTCSSVDLDKYSAYRIGVAASTAVGESDLTDEDYIEVFTEEDVPESPPSDLTVVHTSPSTVSLSWAPPNKANGVILYYVIHYENDTYGASLNTSANSATLTDLKPFSFYDVYVEAFTRLGNGDQRSHSLQLLSGEDVPGGPPQNLSYESVSPNEVNVTWLPPELPNGNITRYGLELWNSTHSLNLTSSSQHLLIQHLKKYTEYNVRVQAYTRVGPGDFSPALNITTLEDVPSDSVHNLTAYNASAQAVVVSWDPPLEPNGRVYYLLSLEEADLAPDLSNQGKFKIFRQTTTDTVFLFTKLRIYFPYVFNVTPATAAGVAYNHTRTLYLRTRDEVPTSAPVLVSSRNVSSSSIAVVWQRPLEANGEITEYSLTLSGPGGTNTTSTTNTSYVLTNLHQYTAYNLSITAATRKGTGPALVLYLHTDEGGPMSPPRNLTIFNHTAESVWLSWEPALEPNGVVTHYGFRILEVTTQTTTLQNSSGPATVYSLSGFRPHSSYEISVCSYTRVGHGDQFSSPVIFTTNESVSEAVHSLYCAGVSWDSVQLWWDEPDKPNGHILFYELSVDLGAHTQLYEAHAFTYTVSGLSPEQTYTVSVSAVNSAGPGEELSCSASTLPESVPAAPRNLTVSGTTADSLTLEWAPPLTVPGLLRRYQITAQLLSSACDGFLVLVDQTPDCVDRSFTLSANVSNGSTAWQNFTLRDLSKYRQYRFRVAAVTSAGVGEDTAWVYERTLAGDPDAPPRDLRVTSTANSLHVMWEEPAVLSGPTKYLIQVEGPGLNLSLVRGPPEPNSLLVSNLTAFSSYSVTVTAFTGPLQSAASRGKTVGPLVFQTLEEEPKSPPTNVTVSVVPEKGNAVSVSFSPPDQPNGNITAYYVFIYQGPELVKNISVMVMPSEENTLSTVIDGLKGGLNYTIQISARNGAGNSPPSPEVHITTAITGTTHRRYHTPQVPHTAVPHITVPHITCTTHQRYHTSEVPQTASTTHHRYHTSHVPHITCTTHQRYHTSEVPHTASTTHRKYHTSQVPHIRGTTHRKYHTSQIPHTASTTHRKYNISQVPHTAGTTHCKYHTSQVPHTAGTTHRKNHTPRVPHTAGTTHRRYHTPQVPHTASTTHRKYHTPQVLHITGTTHRKYHTLQVPHIRGTTHHRYHTPEVPHITGTTYHRYHTPQVPQILNKSPPPSQVSHITCTTSAHHHCHHRYHKPEVPHTAGTTHHRYHKCRYHTSQVPQLHITTTVAGTAHQRYHTLQVPHITAPAKPTHTPQPARNLRGVAMVTHRTIAIHLPACYYSDDNGPIAKIQVIVAEAGVKDAENLTTWRAAFYRAPAPYITDRGFPNPPCETPGPDTQSKTSRAILWQTNPPLMLNNASGIYVIGERDDCMNQTDQYCNGPLKANTVYVFKFRATNIKGEYTDSVYSEHIKTNANGLLTRDEQIILGVLLSFFLAVLLIIIICCSVKLHQHKKEGGTYSPREAEIIETKCKLDQLIAIADMELKQEKINRYSSFFFRRKEIYVIHDVVCVCLSVFTYSPFPNCLGGPAELKGTNSSFICIFEDIGSEQAVFRGAG
ncbi:hypothetical protein WMY93_023465 [Mugilogobius chulae]|uniref:Fibronectin type-III domain-containing protein n=1 Tax=Mugilogobius chulae TaxID=88201 RepID=A0AAW0N9Y5_9GOBI